MAHCPACGSPPAAAASCPRCGAAPSGLPTLGPGGEIVAPAPAPIPEPYPSPTPTGPPPALPPGRYARRQAAASVPPTRRHRPRELCSAVRQSIGVVLTALVTFTAVVAVAAAGWMPTGRSGGLGDWAYTAVLLIALGLGGTLTAPGSGPAADTVVHVMPLVLTAAMVVPLVLLARREERRRPAARTRTRAVRAIASGATATVGLWAVATTSRQLAGGTVLLDAALGTDLAVAPVPTLGAAFVVVATVSFAARITAPPVIPALAPVPMSVRISSPFSVAARPAPPVLPGRPMIEAFRLVVRYAAVLGVAAALTSAVIAVTADGPDLYGRVLYGPELPGRLPTAALLLLGVPYAATGVGLVTDPGPWSFLLLIPVPAALVAAVWHTVSRPVSQRVTSFGTLVRLCATSVVVVAAVAFTQRISVPFAEVSPDGGTGRMLTAGPSPACALPAGLFCGMLLALALRVAPRFALVAPRLLLVLPGRVHPSWAAVLVGLDPLPGTTPDDAQTPAR
jgi:hypothetical protein